MCWPWMTCVFIVLIECLLIHLKEPGQGSHPSRSWPCVGFKHTYSQILTRTQTRTHIPTYSQIRTHTHTHIFTKTYTHTNTPTRSIPTTIPHIATCIRQTTTSNTAVQRPHDKLRRAYDTTRRAYCKVRGTYAAFRRAYSKLQHTDSKHLT